MKKRLDPPCLPPYHSPRSRETRKRGALAQLGERNTGSVEVSGSIPLGSTNKTHRISRLAHPAKRLFRGRRCVPHCHDGGCRQASIPPSPKAWLCRAKARAIFSS